MSKDERLAYIVKRLESADGAVRGVQLAEECGVTRQIIVGDISTLRRNGKKINSSSLGYRMAKPKRPCFKQIMACRESLDRMLDELYTIVDLGGAVLNLAVEHGFYGYVKMDVNVRSHDEADRYLNYFRSTCRSVMDGFQDDGHQYLIETHSKEALARIRSALDALATA